MKKMLQYFTAIAFILENGYLSVEFYRGNLLEDEVILPQISGK